LTTKIRAARAGWFEWFILVFMAILVEFLFELKQIWFNVVWSKTIWSTAILPTDNKPTRRLIDRATILSFDRLSIGQPIRVRC
jgi:hypothetical protein